MRLAAELAGSGLGMLEAYRLAYPHHMEALEVAEPVLTEIRDALEAISSTEQIPAVRRLALMGVKNALKGWIGAHWHKDGLDALVALLSGCAAEIGRLIDPPEVQTVELCNSHELAQATGAPEPVGLSRTARPTP